MGKRQALGNLRGKKVKFPAAVGPIPRLLVVSCNHSLYITYQYVARYPYTFILDNEKNEWNVEVSKSPTKLIHSAFRERWNIIWCQGGRSVPSDKLVEDKCNHTTPLRRIKGIIAQCSVLKFKTLCIVPIACPCKPANSGTGTNSLVICEFTTVLTYFCIMLPRM